MNKQEKKEYLAQLNFCRSFLFLGSMLSDAESKKVHERISRYQDKHRIEISREEINNVQIVYNDATKVGRTSE